MPHNQIEELKSEIESLSRLDHPNIAKFYESFEEQGKKLHLIMELLTGGELYSRLVEETPGGRFSETRSKILTKKICGALSYLHGQGIVHRDLKLENLVFRDRDPESEDIVLIDFGLSKRFSVGNSVKIMNKHRSSITESILSEDELDDADIPMSSLVGSSYYIAPEVLNRNYSGPLCDIWSLGVIVYMMLCGKAPFNGKTEKAIMKKAQTGEYKMIGPVWESISKEAKDFVSRCLTKNVSKRMTASEALNHPWLQSLNVELSISTKKSLPMPLIQNMIQFVELPYFVRVICQAAALSFPRTETTQYADLFELIDSDGDGYITEKDINQALKYSIQHNEIALSDSKTNISDDQIIDALAKKIFNGIDTEIFGLIKFTYFVSAVVQADKYYCDLSILRDAFHKLDCGKKGFIDHTDLERLNFPSSQAQNIVSSFLNMKHASKEIRSLPPLPTGPAPQDSDDVSHPCIEFRDFLISMRKLIVRDEIIM